MTAILISGLHAASIVAGIVALLRLAGRYRASGRKEVLYLAVAAGTHALRTLVFSLAAREPFASAGFLPDGFATGTTASFSFMLLVSITAFYLWKSLDGFRPSRRGRVIAVSFWAAFAVESLILARVALGAAQGFGRGSAIDAPVYDAPFLLAKAFAAGAGLLFMAGLKRSGSRDALDRGGAAVCFVAAQFVDSAMRFTDAERPAGTLMYQTLFFAGVFWLMKAMPYGSAAAAGESRRPEASESSDAFADRSGLAGQERRVFEAVIRGSSNKEIAYDEGISLSAAKRRVRALYRKLGVASRFELMAKVHGNPDGTAQPG